MKRFPIALAVAVALMSATSAFAQDVEINGSRVNQNVTANNNSNIASGLDSVARQAFGAISDAEIRGSTVVQNVTANNNRNVASGRDSEACQEFGVIGDVGGGGGLFGGGGTC
jgi:DNA-binding transcriptional regulator YdaS (Cro superfamily)